MAWGAGQIGSMVSLKDDGNLSRGDDVDGHPIIRPPDLARPRTSANGCAAEDLHGG